MNLLEVRDRLFANVTWQLARFYYPNIDIIDITVLPAQYTLRRYLPSKPLEVTREADKGLQVVIFEQGVSTLIPLPEIHPFDLTEQPTVKLG